MAASIEAFYRSALNAYLNAQLQGGKPPALFPDMHIQLPLRVLYTNGFKGLEPSVNLPESFLAPSLTLSPR